MNCPNCGGANVEGARFCRNCGRPLVAQAPAVQVPMAPGPQAYGGYPAKAKGLSFQLPVSFKALLPMLGMGVALLGMVLPWATGGGQGISGFGFIDIIRTMLYGYGTKLPGEVSLFVASFWIAFACSLVGHILLWKHSVRRLVAVIVGGLGLAAMIAMTVVLFGPYGQDNFTGIKVGVGFILTWLGFALMVGGTLLAWKDLFVPTAAAAYYPPPQMPQA
jgi:hypothetical protein